MPAPKAPESPSGKPATLQQGKAADVRKPWKKKTPVEVVLEQENKLRKEIAEAEEDLKQKRVQLKKFEEARRIFEAS
jgi:hypothetical protein